MFFYLINFTSRYQFSDKQLLQSTLSHIQVNVMDDSEWTALMIATSAGRKEVVSVLLNEGADVNSVNRTGHLLLQFSRCQVTWCILLILILMKSCLLDIA